MTAHAPYADGSLHPSSLKPHPPADPAPKPSSRRWRFATAELDEDSLELRVDGELTALEPKPLQVLLYLLEHAGEVVTKNELAEACWPKRILSDSLMAKTISRLREVLKDEQQTLIRTMHGYGYRLAAPVQIVAAAPHSLSKPVLDLQAGYRPHQRLDWSLQRRLGSGGGGEAWLAQQDNSSELRVFKFPLDVGGLAALKREITLSRLMSEQKVAGAARILGWNLEEEPYFIECEYAPHGNLADWARSRGGLDNIPLAERLDIAIQIAAALGEAHAVGVLHKDLKPENVLLMDRQGTAQVKLADFGSGGVVDERQLEALGITRLGFTRTMTASAELQATPFYLAPERLAGQPATVKGDIYALGVLLYQLLAGDFRQPLAPGWELKISDELLRQDIAQTAAGDPEQRLADAAQLALRLRRLEARHAQLTAERAERQKAEAMQAALLQLRQRRRWQGLIALVSLVGAVVSLALYLQSRAAGQRAEEAAAVSQAVAGFLSQDLFDVLAAEKKPVADWTILDLLNASAPKIEERFSNQPAIAAQLNASLGGAYLVLQQPELSLQQYRQALERSSGESEPDMAVAMRSAADLILLEYQLPGQTLKLDEYEALYAKGIASLGPQNAAARELQRRLNWAYQASGQWQKAKQGLDIIVKEIRARGQAFSEQDLKEMRSLAGSLMDLGDYPAAESLYREILRIEPLALKEGTEGFSLYTQIPLIDTLIRSGRAAEAQLLLDEALPQAQRWFPDPNHEIRVYLSLHQARIHLALGQALKALPSLESFGQAIEKFMWAPEAAHFFLMPLAEAYLQIGQAARAEILLRKHLNNWQAHGDSSHPYTVQAHVSLAKVLFTQGKQNEALRVLQGIDPDARKELPEAHPFRVKEAEIKTLLDESKSPAIAK